MTLAILDTCMQALVRKGKKKHLVAFVLLLVSNNILSQELSIVGDDDGPPKYYLENGQPKGFIVDLTRWVLDDMGHHSYRIKLFP